MKRRYINSPLEKRRKQQRQQQTYFNSDNDDNDRKNNTAGIQSNSSPLLSTSKNMKTQQVVPPSLLQKIQTQKILNHYDSLNYPYTISDAIKIIHNYQNENENKKHRQRCTSNVTNDDRFHYTQEAGSNFVGSKCSVNSVAKFSDILTHPPVVDILAVVVDISINSNNKRRQHGRVQQQRKAAVMARAPQAVTESSSAELWLMDHSIAAPVCFKVFGTQAITKSSLLNLILERQLLIGDILRFNQVTLYQKKRRSNNHEVGPIAFKFNSSWSHPEKGVQWFRLCRVTFGLGGVEKKIHIRERKVVQCSSGENNTVAGPNNNKINYDYCDISFDFPPSFTVPENMETNPKRVQNLVDWYCRSEHFYKLQQNYLSPLPCRRRSLCEIQSYGGSIGGGLISNVISKVTSYENFFDNTKNNNYNNYNDKTKMTMNNINYGEQDDQQQLEQLNQNEKPLSSVAFVTLSEENYGVNMTSDYTEMVFIDKETRYQNILKNAIIANKKVLLTNLVSKKGRDIALPHLLFGHQQQQRGVGIDDDEVVLVPTNATEVTILSSSSSSTDNIIDKNAEAQHQQNQLTSLSCHQNKQQNGYNDGPLLSFTQTQDFVMTDVIEPGKNSSTQAEEKKKLLRKPQNVQRNRTDLCPAVATKKILFLQSSIVDLRVHDLSANGKNQHYPLQQHPLLKTKSTTPTIQTNTSLFAVDCTGGDNSSSSDHILQSLLFLIDEEKCVYHEAILTLENKLNKQVGNNNSDDIIDNYKNAGDDGEKDFDVDVKKINKSPSDSNISSIRSSCSGDNDNTNTAVTARDPTTSFTEIPLSSASSSSAIHVHASPIIIQSLCGGICAKELLENPRLQNHVYTLIRCFLRDGIMLRWVIDYDTDTDSRIFSSNIHTDTRTQLGDDQRNSQTSSPFGNDTYNKYNERNVRRLPEVRKVVLVKL